VSRQKLTGNLPTAINDLKRPMGRPFEKGRKKTGGRQKGTPNKCDMNIRDAVIEACAQVGANGKGLVWGQCNANPASTYPDGSLTDGDDCTGR
jgi:hypothetical protein